MADNEYYNPEGMEGEDAEGADDFHYEPSKQAVMVLIDAAPDMLKPAPGGAEGEPPRSYLRVAVEAVASILRWRIQHAPNDELGVIFYGAGRTNVDAAFEGVHELVALNVPDVAAIHRLGEFTDDVFRDEVGTKAGLDAANCLRFGLWAARERLSTRTKNSKTTYRRVFLFTCNEDPLAGRPQASGPLEQRLEDLHHQRTWLDVFPLLALARPFDMGRFWNHAIQVSRGREDESEGEEGDPDDGGGAPSAALPAYYRHSDLSSYMDDIRARTSPARANVKLEMSFPGGLRIAVKMLALLRPGAKPKRIRVTRDEYQEVKSSAALVHPAGNLLSEARKRAIHFKTKSNTDRMPRAVFDNSELEAVRSPRPAGLALLGFKPASALAPRHTLATARFVYPDERRGRGSTAAFVALHKAMIDADKIAIARLVMRAGNAPSLVALLPQAEEKLALHTQFESLDDQPPPRDATLPDPDFIAAAAPLAEAFSDAVYGPGGAGPAGKTAGVKRKAEPAPHTADAYAEFDWATLAGQDKLSRLTNDQLKVYLRYHNLPLSGKKADFIARITNHVLANAV
ncbi:ATP-dependent DNA helicase 2 subunit 1 [Raphidocelis subcapitata]|uniref:ATP-dependent DNA helicase 2 subunit 1 n=1 Tax=Raphidocelis subcapitata TaxID=307507 RepID=A0A2V0NNS8_9CHLO|nr:ATP-dependent DNA helicase 2 subunit 1 [Raphidocelis subcapitata]|eukprot:GBF89248.1 ATP-dependent DNA helicase 2 subunit 1 [Raphidocelis subcapitata]